MADEEKKEEPKEEKKEEKIEVEGVHEKKDEEKEVKKEKHIEKKGKKARTGRKHESVKPNKFYEIKGNKIERKGKNCPRCGPGTWLAVHKDRDYCGRCGYTEFKNTEKKD